VTSLPIASTPDSSTISLPSNRVSFFCHFMLTNFHKSYDQSKLWAGAEATEMDGSCSSPWGNKHHSESAPQPVDLNKTG
jgi:hypothetical protein